MDSAYSIFNRNVKPVEMKHEAKRLRNRWLEVYNQFNKRLFKRMKSDEWDKIIDRMDEYEEYTSYNLSLIHSIVSSLFAELEFQSQHLASSLLVCNIIAQVAQITWQSITEALGKKETCQELASLAHLSHTLMNLLIHVNENIDPNESEELQIAVSDYMSKTAEWVKSITDES